MTGTVDNVILTLASAAVFIVGYIVFSGNRAQRKQIEFEKQAARAEAFDKEIEKLKKESTRDSEEFMRRLREYRARYGSSNKPSDTT